MEHCRRPDPRKRWCLVVCISWVYILEIVSCCWNVDIMMAACLGSKPGYFLAATALECIMIKLRTFYWHMAVRLLPNRMWVMLF